MIILDEIVSVDGWAARTDRDIDFFVEREGLVETVGDTTRMSHVAAVLLGAQTYREFSDFWPTQDSALYVNTIPKHVLSSTLESAPWGGLTPAVVERGDAADVALRLERDYGGDVIVWGSITLAHALLDAAVVDEVWLRIVPVALGAGRSFWPARDIDIATAETKAHPGGWTTARYTLDRRR